MDPVHHIFPFVFPTLGHDLLPEGFRKGGGLDEDSELRSEAADGESGLDGRAGTEDEDEVVIRRRRGSGYELADKARRNRKPKTTT